MRITILLLCLSITLPAAAVPGAGRWRTPLDSWFLKKRKPWRVNGGVDGAFTPDGKNAAIALENGSVTLYRLRDQKKLAVFDCSLVQNGNFRKPVCLSFSPDGSRLAIGFAGEKTVLLVNIVLQKLYRRIPLPFPPKRLRFSPLGRYLLASDRSDRSGWRSVYSFFKKKIVYRGLRAVPCTFSRNDRYFFVAEPVNREWRVSMIESGSGKKVRLRTIPAMGVLRPPLILRSLRDHRIIIGFQGMFSISDRFMTRIIGSRVTPGHDNGWLLPMSGNGLLLSGGSGVWKLIRLHNGKQATLEVPAGAHCLAVYPKGYAVLYRFPGDRSIRIKRLALHRLRWSK